MHLGQKCQKKTNVFKIEKSVKVSYNPLVPSAHKSVRIAKISI